MTIVLAPFWRWLESATAIESYGHSGPATWCYLIVYFLILAAGALAAMVKGGKKED